MKTKDIHTKLNELDCSLDDLLLGDFDAIGEYTARKARNRDNPLYRSAGCFFRPSYERGILATAMIRRYKPKRVLEIGFGRGYWAVCAAKAMHESSIDGSIISIDVKVDDEHMKHLSSLFPKEWLTRIQLHVGKSTDMLPNIEGDFDMVYIDGDHTLQGVTTDWNLIANRFKQFVIFDDYHLPTHKHDPLIDVARFVNTLDEKYDRELILMDRLIFNDDRNTTERDYGQVILRNPEFVEPENRYTYEW